MRLVLLLTLLGLETTLSARLARYYKIPGQGAIEEDIDREKSATCLLKAHEEKPSAPAFGVKMNGDCEIVQKMDGYFDFYFPKYPGAMLYVKVNDTDPRDFPNLSEEEKQYVINEYLPRRRKDLGSSCYDDEVRSYMEENKELKVTGFDQGNVNLCVLFAFAKHKVDQNEYLPFSVVKAFERMGINVVPPIFQTRKMMDDFRNLFIGNNEEISLENNLFWTDNCMEESGKHKFETCNTMAAITWPAVCSAGIKPQNPGDCNLMSGITPVSEDKYEKLASLHVGFFHQIN